jgi:hypothetical protein
LGFAGALALAAFAWSGPARAQACANPCTDAQVQVNVVYFGATAPNQAINEAMKNLYGDPVNTCTSIIKVYRCRRDLDGNAGNGAETCVRAFVGDNKGSCEGVDAMDNKTSAFNVCNPAGPAGSGGLVPASSLTDESGNPLYANYSGSDVAYSVCEPVVTGSVIQRPNVFDDTESNVFANGFGFIVNRGIEPVLNARAKTIPASGCAYGAGDCQKLDLSMTPQKGLAIFGNNNSCDWRYFSKDVDPTVFRNIGTVMRNRLSGTRRYMNIQILEGAAPGQGNIYESIRTRGAAPRRRGVVRTSRPAPLAAAPCRRPAREPTRTRSRSATSAAIVSRTSTPEHRPIPTTTGRSATTPPTTTT